MYVLNEGLFWWIYGTSEDSRMGVRVKGGQLEELYNPSLPLFPATLLLIQMLGFGRYVKSKLKFVLTKTFPS